MPSDVPDHLRQQVTKRAGYRYEYCLLPQSVALHKHEVDHIVPTQHGGETKKVTWHYLVCVVTGIKDPI